MPTDQNLHTFVPTAEGEEMLDCGHAAHREGIGTGYAITPDGKHICYSCAEEALRKHLEERKEPVTVYLSSDHRSVTSWTGARLANVTSYALGARYSTTDGGHWRMQHIRVRTPGGAIWRGQGSDQYDAIVLRRPLGYLRGRQT